MRNAAQRPVVWLTPRTERERISRGIASSAFQLSRAQKWDLVRICLAALASAAFFSAPFLLSNEPQTDNPAAAAPSVPVEHAAGVQDALDRISIVTTDIRVPVTPVLVRSLERRSQPAASRPATLDASRETSRPVGEGESDSFAKRLGRAIAGDGRYTVQPFPSLDANRY